MFQMVFDMFKMLQSLQEAGKTAVEKEIGHLILIDRDQDLVTPLCTQTTYEGLVDERYGIHCGMSKFVTHCEYNVILVVAEIELYSHIHQLKQILYPYRFLSEQGSVNFQLRSQVRIKVWSCYWIQMIWWDFCNLCNENIRV